MQFNTFSTVSFCPLFFFRASTIFQQMALASVSREYKANKRENVQKYISQLHFSLFMTNYAHLIHLLGVYEIICNISSVAVSKCSLAQRRLCQRRPKPIQVRIALSARVYRETTQRCGCASYETTNKRPTKYGRRKALG